MEKISVYLDDGRVFEYEVLSGKQREHTSAIIAGGYRSCRDGVLEHYPPHRIVKVKATGADTMYTDTLRGT